MILHLRLQNKENLHIYQLLSGLHESEKQLQPEEIAQKGTSNKKLPFLTQSLAEDNLYGNGTTKQKKKCKFQSGISIPINDKIEQISRSTFHKKVFKKFEDDEIHSFKLQQSNTPRHEFLAESDRLIEKAKKLLPKGVKISKNARTINPFWKPIASKIGWARPKYRLRQNEGVFDVKDKTYPLTPTIDRLIKSEVLEYPEKEKQKQVNREELIRLVNK